MTRAFSALEWQIAGRYLRARRREGLISLIAVISFLGIMLGVATLIVVMAVMTGFRADLLDRILGIGGHAIVRPVAGQFDDRAKLAAKLQTLDHVTQATGFVEGQALLSSGQAVRGVIIRGFAEADMRRLPALAENIASGTLDGIGTKRAVVIGARLAERYGFSVGQRLTLIAPRGAQTPFGVAPRQRQFEIAAVFRLGLSEYDLNFVFMPVSAATDFLGLAPQAGAIEIFVDDPDRVEDYTPALQAAIGDAHRLTDWKRLNATLAGALEVERDVMFLILAMILLVAALNIVSGLVMLVRDKGRDIGVMRGIGAPRAMILRIFFITGAAIGVSGTLAGLGLGTAVCAHIEAIRQFLIQLTGADLFPSAVYFLDEIPAQMVFADVARITGLALALSFLSTLYPAWRAASLEPVEALRYE